MVFILLQQCIKHTEANVEVVCLFIQRIFWPIVTDCTFISSSVIINSDNAISNPVCRVAAYLLSRPNNDLAIKVDLQFLQMQITKLQSKVLRFAF